MTTLIGIIFTCSCGWEMPWQLQNSQPSACLQGPWLIWGTARHGDQSSQTSSQKDQSLLSPSPCGLHSCQMRSNRHLPCHCCHVSLFSRTWVHVEPEGKHVRCWRGRLLMLYLRLVGRELSQPRVCCPHWTEMVCHRRTWQNGCARGCTWPTGFETYPSTSCK